MTTQPNYDFTKDWNELDEKTKKAFTKKCEEIEKWALENIAKEYHLNYSEIKNEVTHLDPEGEWYSMDAEKGLPDDYNWIVFEAQFFREDLVEKDLI